MNSVVLLPYFVEGWILYWLEIGITGYHEYDRWGILFEGPIRWCGKCRLLEIESATRLDLIGTSDLIPNKEPIAEDIDFQEYVCWLLEEPTRTGLGIWYEYRNLLEVIQLYGVDPIPVIHIHVRDSWFFIGTDLTAWNINLNNINNSVVFWW